MVEPVIADTIPVCSDMSRPLVTRDMCGLSYRYAMTHDNNHENKAPTVRGRELEIARKSHPNLFTREKLSAASGGNWRTIARAEKGHAGYKSVDKICVALGLDTNRYWIGEKDSNEPIVTIDDKLDELLALARNIPAMSERLDQLLKGTA